MTDSKSVTKTIPHRSYLLGILFVAINMRLPITAIPPLLSLLKKQLDLSYNTSGLLTTIPLLTFALISPLIAKLGNRFGNERTILVFLSLLVLGSFLRIIPTKVALLLGTFILALGIAAANVLLPASIKHRLPLKPMPGIAIYTTTMLLVGALGTGLTAILAAKTSLTTIMWLLALLALISFGGWLPTGLKRRTATSSATRLADTPTANQSIWTTQLGWLITLFFGLQALIYYSLLTWLPQIYMATGFSTTNASTLVTVLQLANLSFAFAVPLIAQRRIGVKMLNLVLGIGLVGGITLMLTATTNFILAVIGALITGAAAGIAFNLAIVFFTKKSGSSATTAISGMAQSAGYVLAAVGPITFGWLKNILGSWQPVLLLTLGLALIMVLVGWLIEKQPVLFE